MRYQVAYLNVYGNAKILADAIMDLLPSDSTECIDLSCQELYDDADVYLMIFEMMRSACVCQEKSLAKGLEKGEHPQHL